MIPRSMYHAATIWYEGKDGVMEGQELQGSRKQKVVRGHAIQHLVLVPGHAETSLEDTHELGCWWFMECSLGLLLRLPKLVST
jgi:hypothetical protein